MKGTTYKRCSCHNPATDKPFGQNCPKLYRASGGWNPTHGIWQYQIELPASADGKRRPLRRGGFDTQTAAETALGKVRNALAVADPHDPVALQRVGDLIDAATKAKKPIPEAVELRRILKFDHTADTIPDTDVWLDTWLTGRKKIRPGTRRSYQFHIELHIKPVIAGVRLDKLRTAHVSAVFDTITDRNDRIAALRTSRDPALRDQVKGLRTISPATMHRIRATFRAALNGAIVAGWIDTNPAKLVELPPAKSPKPLVWTAERVRQWHATGAMPSTIMVWTPTQTGAFLDHTQAANDRLYALYHLVAHRGLRRGESCGLHWSDLDLDAQTVTIRWQIIQLGWATQLEQPKTDSSEAVVALDAETVTVLRAHRVRQWRERMAAGETWVETGLVFTTTTGEALHPADVTDHFQHLARQAGLPPVRLHDLRHGAATIALAAGVDMKTVQEMLRHSSITVTSDIYTTVLPELAIAAAEKSAASIPRRRSVA